MSHNPKSDVEVRPTQEDILHRIRLERHKQEIKWGQQNNPITCFTLEEATKGAELYKSICDEAAAQGALHWDLILLEEVYEAIEAAASGNAEDAREELIQVAAVVVAMIESLDRNGLEGQ